MEGVDLLVYYDRFWGGRGWDFCFDEGVGGEGGGQRPEGEERNVMVFLKEVVKLHIGEVWG